MDFGRSTALHVEEHVSEVGRLVAWQVSPQVWVSKAQGRMQLGHAEAWMRLGDRMVATGLPFAGFHDWTEMESYDSETRRLLTDWSLAHRAQFIEVHLAVRSRLVRMGVTVANLALGNFMVTHESVDTMEKAFLETLARLRRERSASSAR